MTDTKPTPRTDAFVDKVWDAEKLKHPIREYNGLADFARTLERELAAIKSQPVPDEPTPRTDALYKSISLEREAMREKLDAEEQMIPIASVKERDELFKKYQADGWIGPTSFKAALREYGALVRKEYDTLRDLLELRRLVTPMMEFKRREWVGLTDGEVQECIKSADRMSGEFKRTSYWANFAIAIEAKLKEKNT